MSTRIAILWTCTGLFLLRVLGQLEVVLISPSWLPPMEQWYSGLLPYPLLLPAQILLLMLMSGLVVREMLQPRLLGDREWLRIAALVYFAVMVTRLIVQFIRGADNVIDAGGIPIMFHWVLALFLLVLSRTRAIDRAHGMVERLQ